METLEFEKLYRSLNANSLPENLTSWDDVIIKLRSAGYSIAHEQTKDLNLEKVFEAAVGSYYGNISDTVYVSYYFESTNTRHEDIFIIKLRKKCTIVEGFTLIKDKIEKIEEIKKIEHFNRKR